MKTQSEHDHVNQRTTPKQHCDCMSALWGLCMTLAFRLKILSQLRAVTASNTLILKSPKMGLNLLLCKLNAQVGFLLAFCSLGMTAVGAQLMIRNYWQQQRGAFSGWQDTRRWPLIRLTPLDWWDNTSGGVGGAHEENATVGMAFVDLENLTVSWWLLSLFLGHSHLKRPCGSVCVTCGFWLQVHHL